MPDQRTDLTRERIVRAATDLFAEKGYHATSVAELQAAVGFQRGGLYHHIESKESILFEICKIAIDEAVVRARRVVETEDDPIEQFRQLGRQWVRHIADNRAAWTVFFREFSSLSEERRAEIRDQRDEVERCWRQVLEQGMETGRMRELHPIVLNGILGMFNYCYLWLDPRGPLTPDEIADAFVDLLAYGAVTETHADVPVPG